MKVTQAYRFALDLTAGRQRAVLAHAGAARVAHNWALARVKANLGQRAAERSYGVPEAELTPALGWSLPALRRAWNQAKPEVAPWWVECSKEAFNTGPDRRTSRRPSNRWLRTQRRLGAAHARVANLRRDGLHKLTTSLATTYGTVVEDLNVSGMLRNRQLARHVADAGFAELRRQLDYKTGWNGGQLVVADRWYPSSKTCSACGAVKAKLALSERTYTCTTCGLVLDRDLNAAQNLAALAATVAGSGSETLTGRGADRETPFAGRVAAKRLPGTATAGQTGTVSPQSGTASQELTHAH